MRLTVLTDNNTFIDKYYLGEPALCYYLEDDETSLLFDTGYSDIYLKNADALGLDLSALTHVVFSHGHNDHTRGLTFLHEHLTPKKISLVAHPDVFIKRYDKGIEIGCPLDRSFLDQHYTLKLSKDPLPLSETLLFLGEIPQYWNFERRKPVGIVREQGEAQPDLVPDDSALVYMAKDGLFIITGCSHSGICNIVEHAKNICGQENILGIIGGFHLFEPSEQLAQTILYFEKNKIGKLYPCHCVSFAAKAEIHKRLPVHEVGVGLEIRL